jgi:hypothetical protein
MKKIPVICLLAAALALALPVAASAPAADLAAFFPDLDGWTKDGTPEAFLPENLYEHIDGAAENFLAYGFRQLAVQNYTDPQKRALSAEIYFHGTAENAFGIYGSEKPLTGDYLRIGGQGYYEEGVLNFISDAYYVKLNGFDLGGEGREILLGLAGRIAAAIHGTNLLPETLDSFPASGRIAHSERVYRRLRATERKIQAVHHESRERGPGRRHAAPLGLPGQGARRNRYPAGELADQ